MIKTKFDQLCSSIRSTFLSEKLKKPESTSIETVKSENLVEQLITIDIDWDDISGGVRESSDNSVISRALRKHGYHGIVSESLIELENGSVYYPEDLTIHWELFYSSMKSKPATINYKLLL